MSQSKPDFIPGIPCGRQLNFIDNDEIEMFVVPKDAISFVQFRCDSGLKLADVSRMTSITIDVLQKLERGEIQATHYWWHTFRKMLNEALEEKNGS